MTTIHRIPCPIPFPLKTVNCYYIADSKPTLIDTSVDTPDSLAVLSAGIERAGSRLSGIRRIILTHAHTDHAGMAGRLAHLSGAEVFVHRWDAPKIVYGDRQKTAEHLNLFRQFLSRAGVPDTLGDQMTEGFRRRLDRLVSPIEGLVEVSGGEVFDFDDFQLRTLHTAGHSAGSISLFNQITGEIFAGDTLLQHITPNPVAETNLPPDIPRYESIRHYRQSLLFLASLGIDTVLPGHGPPFRQPGRRIDALNRHFDRRKQVVLQLMRHRGGAAATGAAMTVYELSNALFPRLKELELFLGISEAFAYLQFLESDGLVSVWQENGTHRFTPTPAATSDRPPMG